MNASVSRRQFIFCSAGVTFLASRTLAGFQQRANPSQLSWHKPAEWGVEGRGFDDTEHYYDRLPARAKEMVRKPVWDLSRHSAGIAVRFNTDSPEINVRYKLTSANLAMPHMPATGVSGVDLYALDEQNNWRWVSVLKPTQQVVEAKLAAGLQKRVGRPREFMIYLPLYNGTVDLEIGVPNDAKFERVAPRTDKPIVFYGTSIMQGACASRSGMAIPAIVGRRLNKPTINLGFSGNGRMEKEVGQFLGELDPCVFVIDCLPNMNAQTVTANCQPLVRQLRAARPDTPILLVEDRVNTNAWIRSGASERHAANRAALKRSFDELIANGVQGLHYLPCDHLLGSDGEAATDGSHPSDLGMVRYADAYQSVLKKIL
jgi:lysophospholipase L1-like esterase